MFGPGHFRKRDRVKDLSVADAASRLGVAAKRFLSAEETAVVLGLSVRTLYNLRSQGKLAIRPKKMGKLLKFDIFDLLSYVEELP